MGAGRGHAVGAAADEPQLLPDVRLFPRALALELLLHSVETRIKLRT